MKYFGTDGIRSIIGKTINYNFLKKLGKAIVCYYKKHNFSSQIIIGNDSRSSGSWISSVLQSVLLRHGIECYDIGICSSPCLAFLTQKNKFPVGVMISASHNPAEYNGIKFFDSFGKKVDEEFELEMESYIEKPFTPPIKYVKSHPAWRLKNDYIIWLKQLKKVNYPCLIDCSNGGGSDIARAVFPSTKLINHTPRGDNINKNSGCTHIENLANLCKQKKLVGFAFDGDADRVIAVDPFGEIIDGDKILYILSKFYLKSGDKLIGTINTNAGLQESLTKRNITLIRTQVGDKNVCKMMLKSKSMLGGEESGHIIIKRHTNTGDGILTAICLMNILHLTNLSFQQLLDGYSEYQISKCSLSFNKPYRPNEDIAILINKYTSEGARIVIRKSGTEPVLRLLVEHKNKSTADKMLANLVLSAKKLL